jgi:HD superfamily phosphodiesterase
MNRLGLVRQEVDTILLGLTSDENRRCGFVHLYGTALTATWLAARRGLDSELAAVAGMLHDLTNYTAGESPDHAHRSSEAASLLLETLGLFSRDEIAEVTRTIARHSDKAPVGTSMDELLKDADVFHHWLYNPSLPPQASHAARREKLERELGVRP